MSDVVSVSGIDQQSTTVDVERWCELAKAVLIDEGVDQLAELALWFVDEDEIAALNEAHMDESGPTDVLSFPLDRPGDEPQPADMPLLLGDVFVCPAVAARDAGEDIVDDAIALLVVHGVLHILGYDHAEPHEAQSMRAREQALLSEHYRNGPR